MTPESQRIAIAEACGWTEVFKGTASDCVMGTRPDGLYDTEIPDYLNDLNARHDAWRSLSEEQKQLMHAHIIEIATLKRVATEEVWFSELWLEAFLRTIGKWV